MAATVDGSAERRIEMRRVFFASIVGTIIEWYDFLLYGIAAALIFNKLFFPTQDPLTGTLIAFATYAVGFAVRPFGGIFFGNLGDRIGRKAVLMMTVLLMGIATTIVGLLPTYAQIGIWAPVLLTLVRVVQGFGAGAEFAGAAVMMVEYAPPRRRGLYGSWSQVGVALGLIAAFGINALVTRLAGPQLLTWAWRVPFLLSFLLVIVAVYIRSRLLETPVFRELQAQKQIAKAPMLEVLRTAPRGLLTVLGARFADNSVFYVGLVFVLAYAAQHVKITSTISLTGIFIGAIVQAVLIPFFGSLSDRIGRRAVYGGACLLGAIFAFPFFWLVDTGSPPLIWLAIAILVGVIYSGMAGPQPAYFCEQFEARYRYSGVAGGRELGAIIGGLVPFVATALLKATHAGWPEALFLAVMCLISFASAALGPEGYEAAMPGGERATTATSRV